MDLLHERSCHNQWCTFQKQDWSTSPCYLIYYIGNHWHWFSVLHTVKEEWLWLHLQGLFAPFLCTPGPGMDCKLNNQEEQVIVWHSTCTDRGRPKEEQISGKLMLPQTKADIQVWNAEIKWSDADYHKNSKYIYMDRHSWDKRCCWTSNGIIAAINHQ